jgi:hypothetical protein
MFQQIAHNNKIKPFSAGVSFAFIVYYGRLSSIQATDTLLHTQQKHFNKLIAKTHATDNLSNVFESSIS